MHACTVALVMMHAVEHAWGGCCMHLSMLSLQKFLHALFMHECMHHFARIMHVFAHAFVHAFAHAGNAGVWGAAQRSDEGGK